MNLKVKAEEKFWRKKLKQFFINIIITNQHYQSLLHTWHWPNSFKFHHGLYFNLTAHSHKPIPYFMAWLVILCSVTALKQYSQLCKAIPVNLPDFRNLPIFNQTFISISPSKSVALVPQSVNVSHRFISLIPVCSGLSVIQFGTRSVANFA